MPPTNGPEKKNYTIRFMDGSLTQVSADTVCEPVMTEATGDIMFYVFKRGDVAVAKYRRSEVSGWQIDN